MVKKNCENVIEKIKDKLSKFRWLHPQDSTLASVGMSGTTNRIVVRDPGRDGQLLLG